MNNLITEKYSVNLLPQMEIVNNEISDSFPGFIENFLVKHLEDTNNDELNNLTNFNEEEHISDIGEITIPISVELFQEPLQVNLIDVPLICDDNNLSTKISPTTTNCVKKSNLNDKNHNVYLCFKCYEEFHSLGLFREHLKSHKTEKTFKCPKCSTGFNLENNFKIHLIIEHFNNNLLEDNICCPICRVTFQRKASLKSHVLIHQIEELFLCELCQGEYENEDELFKHMETHASVCNKEQNKFPQEESALICSQCKVEAENFEEYKMHIEKHAEIKRIILKGKRKGKTKNLKTYSNNSSSSSGTWKCKFCSRTFSKASLLHRHERIHTGEKPFKCPLCSRAFAQMGSLRIHLDKHSGFKPYECSLCSAKFTQKGNLRAHVEKTHTAPKEATQQIYKCSQCTCIFKKISSLNGHVTKVHINENFGPPTRSDLVLNSLSFMENSNGKSALFKSTNNKCNNVNLNVEDNFIKLTENHENDGLRRYTVYQKKIDDIRWYFCVYCTSKFKKPSDLIRHFRTHTLEKPFKCLQCNQSFSLKSTLTSHKKIHERCSNNENNSNKKLELFKSSKNDVAPLIEPILKEPALNNNNNNKSSLLLNNNEKNLLLERPHHCKICNARFTRIMSLKRHMLHHSGEKKFRCLICPKAFVTKYSLKEHMNYHQNIKNYHCTICAKKFVTSSLLKRHQFIHSNNAKKSSISCTQCGKLLKTSALLKNHMKKIHPEVDGRNDETTTEIFQEINAAEEIPQIQQVYFNLNNDEEILTLPAIFNQQQQEIIVNSHQGIVENSENVDLSIENGVALNLNDIPINLIDAGTNINNNNNNNNNSVEIPLDAQVICINCHKMFSDYLRFEKHNCYYGEEIMENENFNIYLNQAAENPENFQADDDDDDDDEQKKFTCFQCNFSTVDEESFRKHLLIHPAEKMCKFCGKFFKKMCDLTRHIRTHTGEKPFECETCQRKFSLKSTLESHLKTHNATGRALKFGCKVCSSNFASKSSLKLHQSLHTGEKPYKCRICTDTFRTSAIRKSHEKLHENSTETFIVMDPSGVNWLNLAAAAENQDLLENFTDIPVLHVTTGTNDDDDDQRLFVEEEEVPKKKFQCDICAKFYSSKDVLRKHKKALHGQNRKFPCIKCDKVFYQLEDVNKHIGEFHSGNRPYSCQFCANSFGEERGLKTHIKRLHSQQKVEEEETTTTTTTTNNALFLGLEKDAFFSN